ncbi:MAG: hypothetical protein U1F68_19050 [Gammaproteobacteria bacterium]
MAGAWNAVAVAEQQRNLGRALLCEFSLAVTRSSSAVLVDIAAADGFGIDGSRVVHGVLERAVGFAEQDGDVVGVGVGDGEVGVTVGVEVGGGRIKRRLTDG